MTKQIILPKIHEVKAELCKRRLFYFLKEFWDVIINNPYEDNFNIEYFCDEIQLVIDKYVFERPPHIQAGKWYPTILDDIKKNLVGNMPPGTTKSTILSRAVPAWVWCIDDSKSIMSNTISASNASGFAKDSLDIIKSDKYRLYFPTVRVRRDVSAKTYYESENGGIRYSVTTNSKSKTGKHVDLITDDDAMDYSTAQSPAEAAECIEGFKALQSRKKDKRKTPYILFMQRLSTKDTAGHALKVLKDDVRHLCLPAEDIYQNINPPELRKYYIDGLLDPKRLSRKVLADQRAGLLDDNKPISDVAYNIQYNQIAQSVDGLLYPELNFVDALPPRRGDEIRLSFTDVADTGADYFATPFFEINAGKMYWFDSIYTQEGSSVTSPLLKRKIQEHGSIINKMETNNQGSVYVTLLQNMGVHVEGYYSSGNKAYRITSFAQFMSKIYIVRANPVTQPQHNQAVKHLQAYPKIGKAEDGHDDIEDAVTQFIWYMYENYKYLFEIS